LRNYAAIFRVYRVLSEIIATLEEGSGIGIKTKL